MDDKKKDTQYVTRDEFKGLEKEVKHLKDSVCSHMHEDAIDKSKLLSKLDELSH